ncbi:hypothetical protein [Cellulomonas shaoxiangyii]|uniref:Uncharacterized protein n=1 Tax=Cellulomonas shaoxiangyii TaxID=2566013 RepID=A0A4P7SPQ5_9CELL|nr:hypothetical protein [Cellulomonas shaoxiangyii]QCB94713.1 hypothetical protein E5225_15270 [Cellulomonas shaoxiangyii]TGY85051.1 hypothetical protein E5226_08255 [Cellulomonas shaoxiangyii]
MQNPTDALEAVADAAAVLTYAVSTLEPQSGIGMLAGELDRLARAVARAQVIATVDPEASLDEPVPGCFAPEDATEHADDLATLEAIAAMPTGPVMVAVRVRPLDDESAEDALRVWLNGQHLRAVPAGERYEVDGNRLASAIAEHFLPCDE